MKLPGLNFNPAGYDDVKIIVGDMAGNYKEIPFSDWLPPDFEDVWCARGGSYNEMYYSPATGMMVPSDSENGFCAFEPSDLTTWLKKIS